MENKKWTDSELRIAFEDGCKFLHFKDLQDFLLKQRQNVETNDSQLSIINIKQLLLDYSIQLKKQGTLTKGQNEKKLVDKFLKNNYD